MGVGLRPTEKPVDEPPDPKAVRAVFLSRLRGRSGNWPFYLDYNLIRTMGLTNMASYLGFRASDIVKYRKCQLCEKLFNSAENLAELENSVKSGLISWTR